MPIRKDLEKLRQVEKLNFYENSIIPYNTLLIFWILENEVDISQDDIQKLTEAIFAATLGYRMLDLNQDHNMFDSSKVVLSLSLINTFENLLLETFNDDYSAKTIKKYVDSYCEVEYLEKSNRWKPSPFTLENVSLLSYKAAPSMTIFELLYRKKKFSEVKINDLIHGLANLMTSTQLCDDIIDVQEDLMNGFETAVMSGYYEHFGINSEVTREKISVILNPARMRNFYEVNVSLIENARKIFERYDDNIFNLFLEVHYYQFNSSFETA
jgi:hypothetical protein